MKKLKILVIALSLIFLLTSIFSLGYSYRVLVKRINTLEVKLSSAESKLEAESRITTDLYNELKELYGVFTKMIEDGIQVEIQSTTDDEVTNLIKLV